MVETAGLENRYARKGIEGSNPSLSVPVNIWGVSAIAYAVARTVAAGVLIVLAIRRRASGVVAAQAVSDAAVALLVLAYALYALRAALGLLVIPLFLFFVAWELLTATRRLDLLGETPGSQVSDAELLGGTARWFWEVLNIVPAFVLGALVMGNAVTPGGLELPGTPSALSCRTAEVTPGGRVSLAMRTPHGPELGVFTPRRGYLIIRAPVAAGSVPDAERFEGQSRFALPVASLTGRRRSTAAPEPVFTDAGAYTFSISQYRDPSVAFTCVVRYRQAP